MPSPVGHTIFGLGIYVVWCKNLRAWLGQWPLILWVIFCANLPDFDLFAGLLTGDLTKYHQTYTHTLGFVLFVALVIFFALKVIKSKNVYSITFLTFLAVFSNVILDLFNYDSREPVGVMLFWPFSNKYFHLLPVFYPVPHSRPGDIFSPLFTNAVNREVILLFIPFLVLVWFKFKRSYGKD